MYVVRWVGSAHRPGGSSWVRSEKSGPRLTHALSTSYRPEWTAYLSNNCLKYDWSLGFVWCRYVQSWSVSTSTADSRAGGVRDGGLAVRSLPVLSGTAGSWPASSSCEADLPRVPCHSHSQERVCAIGVISLNRNRFWFLNILIIEDTCAVLLSGLQDVSEFPAGLVLKPAGEPESARQ